MMRPGLSMAFWGRNVLVIQSCNNVLFSYSSDILVFIVFQWEISFYVDLETANCTIGRAFSPLKIRCSAYVSCEFSSLWSCLCSWLGAGYHWRNSHVLLSLNFCVCTFYSIDLLFHSALQRFWLMWPTVVDGVDFDYSVLLGLIKAWQLGDNFWYPVVIQFCLEIFWKWKRCFVIKRPTNSSVCSKNLCITVFCS